MHDFLIKFKPVYSIILVNLIGFLLLFYYIKPFEKITLVMGLLFVFSICLTYAIIIMRKMGDEYLFVISAMLVSIGVIMLFRIGRSFGVNQLLWLVLGIVVFFISYMLYLKFDIWSNRKMIYFYIAFSFLFFIITIIAGKNINGANNWINIGKFNFQPSEIIKIIFVFYISSYFVNPKSLCIKCFNDKIIFFIISYMYFGFLILQRDWGIATLLFFVYLTYLYILGFGYKLLVINSILASIFGFLGYFFLHHIQVRINAWLNPWQDIANVGYQITQSLFAIASGGLLGSGLGMGRPDFIPAVQTDFIFSAICEEMGILGGIAVILLFFLFIYRGFKISISANEPFHKILSCGITLLFAYQTFMILGGVTGLIPLTGITLPFISYGGSSLVTNFISLGILQAISNKI